MPPLKTYYDTLQISRTADAAVVRAAYRALCQQYHPDKNPDDPARANTYMKRINEAYEVFSDKTRREAYDTTVAQHEAKARTPEHSSDGPPRRKQPRETADVDKEKHAAAKREAEKRLEKMEALRRKAAMDAASTNWKSTAERNHRGTGRGVPLAFSRDALCLKYACSSCGFEGSIRDPFGRAL